MVSRLISTVFLRHLSTSTKIPKLPKVPTYYKNFALREAQKVLTDYLHSTRSLPYAYAERIAKNSPFSIANLIAQVRFSAPNFSKDFKKFLRYHPINEFEFFFESIGIEYNDVCELLPANKLFFSDDGTLLDAASALSEFGFPWVKLGKIYIERSSLFRSSAAQLKSKLCEFKTYGFNNVEVSAICLAFPYVLNEEGEVGAEIDALFTALKLVFFDFDLASSVEGNVDSWYEVCRKIRVFYDLHGEKGKLGELVGRNKNIFLEHGEEDLIRKAEYFCRFGGKKEEVALLLLQVPELLKLDLEKPVMSVLKLLKHLGLSLKQLKDVSQNYAHVLGINKMANLPNVMRALDLHEWFFNKIKDGNHQLLITYIENYPNEDQDTDYQAGLEKIRVSHWPSYTMCKLNFLHGLGFGENALTMKVLAELHGTSGELQKRFDYLLHSGFKFSDLCIMLRKSPKIINQNPEMIEQKLNFLSQEQGISLEYLNTFPAFLTFNLENRIKPRLRFHVWLREKGLCTDNHATASIIATSEKKFVALLFKIHPAAPKHWFELFSQR